MDRQILAQMAMSTLLRETDPVVIEQGLARYEAARQEAEACLRSAGLSLAAFYAADTEAKAALQAVRSKRGAEGVILAIKRYDSAVEKVYAGIRAAGAAEETHLSEIQRTMDTRANFLMLMVGGVVVVGLILTIFWGWYFQWTLTAELSAICTSLHETTDVVESSAQQLAGASTSLADGATKQASSLEETSASMAEMSKIAKRNAGTAHQVNDLMIQQVVPNFAQIDNRMKAMEMTDTAAQFQDNQRIRSEEANDRAVLEAAKNSGEDLYSEEGLGKIITKYGTQLSQKSMQGLVKRKQDLETNGIKLRESLRTEDTTKVQAVHDTMEEAYKDISRPLERYEARLKANPNDQMGALEEFNASKAAIVTLYKDRKDPGTGKPLL
ncbi:MAG: hypothetical protein WCK00_17230, partial [Deltaproteobacteria bacterium]